MNKRPITIWIKIFAIVMTIALAGGVLIPWAAALTCDDNATGSWNAAGTWTSCGGGTPGASDNVTINSHTVTMTANHSINDVTISGTLAMGSNRLTVGGFWDATGGVFTWSGTNAVMFTSTGSETIKSNGNAFKNFNINAGLVGYWKLDDGFGSGTNTVALDSSGYGNHGTLTNMAADSTDWITSGTFTNFTNPYALDFDLVDDLVLIGSPATLNNLGPMSVSAWIYPRSNGETNGAIVVKNNANGGGRWLFEMGDLGTTNDGFHFEKNGTTSVLRRTADLTITYNDWQHVVATWDGTTTATGIHIYKNGVELSYKTTQNGASLTSDTALPVVIGNNSTAIRTFDGRIDDVRVYNRVLNNAEIIALAAGNQFTGGSGRFTLQDTLDVNGTIIISSGTLDVSASRYPITVAGNWINNGGAFEARTGTVIFDGTSQQILSSETFYNFKKVVTAIATMTFAQQTTLTIEGTMRMEGANASNLLWLRSSISGTRWRIDPQGIRIASFINVKDSNNIETTFIDPANSTDAGNNFYWFSPGITVAGTVYSNEGITPLGNVLVQLAIDGVLSSSDTTTVSGTYSIVPANHDVGEVLTLYLNNETQDAVTVTVASGASLTGVNLYQDRLITRHDNSGSLTSAHLSTAAVVSETDISNIYSISANNTLIIATGKELWVSPTGTFAPGITVYAENIDINGVFAMGSGLIRLTGSFDATGGSFSSSGRVMFASTDNNETIKSNGNAFNDLYINDGLLGYWKLDEGSSPSKDYSGYNNHGTWLVNPTPSSTVPSTINFDNPGSMIFDNTSGEAVSVPAGAIYLANKSFTISAWAKRGGIGVDDFIIGQGSGSNNLGLHFGFRTTNQFTCAFWGNDLDTGATYTDTNWHHWACTYNAVNNSRRIYRDGVQVASGTAGADYQGSGVFYIGDSPFSAGTAEFSGLIDEVRVYDRVISTYEIAQLAAGNQPGTGTGYFTLQDALDVNGSLIINTGTLDVSASRYPITVAGSWANNGGDFIERTGTVTFDGTNQDILSSETFYNFKKVVTATDTFVFGRRTTLIITGTMRMQGANAGNLLWLRSSTSGTEWDIDPQGTRIASFLNVKDSDNINSLIIGPTNSTNAGNTINWFNEVGGVVYSDEGITTLGSVLVRLAINGTDNTSDTTDSSGIYQITPSTTINVGGVLTVYLEDAAQDGVTVTVSPGGGLPDLDIYKDRLITRQDNSGTLTNANLNTAEVSDTDISSVYALSAANTLIMVVGKELWISSTGSFAPGGRVYADNIDVNGVFAMAANDVRLTGSFDATGGSFTTGGQVMFTSTGNETIKSNGSAFYHLVINDGLVGYWKFDDGFGSGTNTTAGDSSGYRNNGTLTLMAADSTDWVASGTFTNFANPYALDFDGADDYVDIGDVNLLDTATTLTGCAWVNHDTNSDDDAILGKIPSGGAEGFYLWRDDVASASGRTDTYTIYVADSVDADSARVEGASNKSTLNIWTHVCFTFAASQSSGLHLYINGVEDPNSPVSTASVGAINAGVITFKIGGGSSDITDGRLDDVRIYDRVLSAYEIAQMAAGNQPGTGSGYFTLQDNLDVEGSLIINTGTLDVSASRYGVSVAGNWVNNGGDFIERTGTVTLDGTSKFFAQEIPSSETFYNLKKVAAFTHTLIFGQQSTVTINGTMRLEGKSTAERLWLRSSAPGTQWDIDPQGIRIAQYLHVKDSENIDPTMISPTASLDGGNTINWFVNKTVSGTAYSDEGITPLGSTLVRLAIDGEDNYSATTNGSGIYSINGSGIFAGSVLTLYLEDAAQDAVTVTVSDGNTLTGVYLYQNRLITRHDNNGSLTGANLSTAIVVSEADVSNIYSVSSLNTLIMVSGKELWISSSGTFAPGIKVYADNLDINGTFVMGSNLIRINGSFDATGGSFTSTGNVMFASTDNNETIKSGGNAFNDLYINDGLLGYWKLDETSSPSKDYSGYGNNGTWLISPTSSTTVAGTIKFADTRSMQFDNTADEAISIPAGAIDLANKSFTLSAWAKRGGIGADDYIVGQGTAVGNLSLHMGLRSANTFTCAFFSNDLNTVATYTDTSWHHWACTYNAVTNDRRIFRDGTQVAQGTAAADYQGSGIFYIGDNPASGGGEFNGLIDDVRVYNRVISTYEISQLALGNQPGTATGYYTLQDALDVNGSLIINTGTLDVSSSRYSITVGKNWSNNGGDFIERTATVTFDGTSQTIPSSETFYNFKKVLTSTDTMYFGRRSTLIITGTMRMQGANASNLLWLRSTTSGTQWKIDPQGTRSNNFLNVKDSNNINATVINPPNSLSGGNTINWFLANSITIKGTAYSDEGITALGSVLVRLAVEGVDDDTDTTTVSGTFSLSTTSSQGQVLTLYLEDVAQDAVTVTLSNGHSLTGVNLYQDRLITRHDNSGSLTSTDLTTAAVASETDISSIYTISSNNTLIVPTGKELWISPPGTFAPGITVFADNLDINGTFAMGSNFIRLTGSFDATGGSFTSTGQVMFISTGNETIKSNGSAFYDLKINDSLIGHWKFDDGFGSGTNTVAVDSSWYRNNGTLTNMSADNTDWVVSGTFTHFVNSYALDFDLVNDIVIIGNPSILNDIGAMTVSAWIYPRSNGETNGTIVYKGGTGGTGRWSFYVGDLSGTDDGFHFEKNGTTAVLRRSSDFKVTYNDWQHVAVTWDGTTNGTGIHIYKNGIELGYDTTQNGASLASDATQSMNIGNGTPADRTFDGMIDDVRIYDRVLNANEIARMGVGNQPGTGSGYFTLQDALDVNGSLILDTGTLDIGSNRAITIAGNWVNNGGDFVEKTGTVIFDGTSTQQIPSSETFYNFKKVITSTATMIFGQQSTLTITGTMRMQGANASNLLWLRSSSSGTEWNIDPKATRNNSYLQVKDSDNISGVIINPSNSTDGGNTLGWFLGPEIISGTVYSNEGITPLSSVLVQLAINGIDIASNTTTVAGTFSITSSPLIAGDVLTLYLENVSQDAVTVTVSDGNSLTGVNLYQDRLITRHDNSGSLTSTDLTTAAVASETDISNLYTISIQNTLLIPTGKELWVSPPGTFAPGVTVFAENIDINGNFAMGSNLIRLTGSFDATGGSFTSTGQVMFISTGNETIKSNGSAFNDLIINDSLIGHWKFDDGFGSGTNTVAVDSSGYRNNGTLTNMTADSTDWVVSGTFTNFANSYALDFDLVNDIVIVGNPSILNDIGAMTISAWIYPRTNGETNGAIIYKGSTGLTGRWVIEIGDLGGTNDGFMFTKAGSTTLIRYSSDFTLTYNDWQHVTVTWDGTTNATGVHIYKNGIELTYETSTNGASLASDAALSLNIGNGTATDRTFDGRIDDVRIYDRVLNTNEIVRLGQGNQPKTGSGLFTLQDALDVNGSLILNSGTLDVTTSRYGIMVAGNWVNNGGDFIERTGTVTFDGTSQQIPSSETFYNFKKVVTSTATMTFGQQSTLIITGTMRMQGANASNLLWLRSSASGTQWNINPQGTRMASYLNVKDSENINATVINPTNSTDGGNTINWFSTDISGIVYSDEGITPLGSVLVRLAVNGVDKLTDTTDGSGAYSITPFATTLSVNAVLTLYLEDAAQDAVTVTVSNSLALSGVNLYQDRLITRHDNNGSLTNAMIRTGTMSAESDLSNIFFTTSGNTLTMVTGKELWVSSVGAYAPGGRVYADNLDINGVMTMAANDVRVAGSFDATGGSFTSTGQVMFTSTGNETIKSNGSSFYNLNINDGLVSYWKFDDGFGSGTNTTAIDSSGYGNNGTLTLMAADSTDWVTSGTFTNFANPYALDFDGTDDRVTVPPSSSLGNLTNNLTITAWVRVRAYSANFGPILIASEVNSDNGLSFVVNSNSTLLFTTKNILDYTSTVSVSLGVFHHVAVVLDGLNDATYYLDGTAQQTVLGANPANTNTDDNYFIGGRDIDNPDSVYNGLLDDVRIYNRVLSAQEIAALAAGNEPQLGGAGLFTLQDALDVNGSFIFNSGTFDVSSSNYAVRVAGNWINNGGNFIHRTGTVSLDGSSVTQAVLEMGSFYNLELVSTKTLNLKATLITTATLQIDSGTTTVTTSGTFDLIPNDVDINATLALGNTDTKPAGRWDATGGTFTSTGKVMFTSTGSETIKSNSSAFNDLIINDITDGLVGYWTFDREDIVWQTATDRSGYNNHGTLTSGPFNVSGTFGSALSFDGSNDYVDITSFNGFAATQPMTISTWVNPSAVDGTQNIIVQGGRTGGEDCFFRVEIDFTGSDIFHAGFGTGTCPWPDATNFVTATTTPAANQWYHLASVYDGSTIKLYVNGRLEASKSLSISLRVPTGVTVGKYNGGAGNEFPGMIDDVRIYNRDLSAREIALLSADRSEGGVFTLQDALDVNGTFMMTIGTLDVSASRYPVTVAGSWLNSSGDFVPRTGTVTFDGTRQDIIYSETFYNFKKVVASTDTMYFGQRSTLTIEGTMRMQGAASNLLWLRSSNAGSQWQIDPSGSRIASYLQVKDSNNINATVINPTNSTDGGNTINWFAATGPLRGAIMIVD